MKKLLLILSMILGLNTSAVMAAALTQAELNATLVIITNFILSDNTVYYHGIQYKPVTSPYTGRVWLDRNLGASQVCTSFNDPLCYGDYYQWGRDTDGHQVSNSSTTIVLAIDINSAESGFIINSVIPFDWTLADSDGSLRSAKWSSVDGSSVCPVGYRVPTLTELKTETLDNGVTDSDTAFTNFLKLPSAGERHSSDGYLAGEGSWAGVWTDSVYSPASFSRMITIDGSDAYVDIGRHAYGYSVRCIKNTTPVDIVPPVITITGGTTVNILLNDTYSDAGATALDNVDSNLTVSSFGSVNTSIAGDYNITYRATDSEGNVASAVRTVSVLFPINYHGTGYSTVTSPYTGRVWLDRNLGASRVCTYFNDPLCYGDYYQWGRNADGHQVSTSTTTTTLATDVNNVGHGDFIANSYVSYDWASVDSNGSLRATNWSAGDGSSVCPVGFRVPTISELKAELLDIGSAEITNHISAFNSFLKLPAAGHRASTTGVLTGTASLGTLSAITEDGSSPHYVSFDGSSAGATSGLRMFGSSVRCIKNTIAADVTPPVITVTGSATLGLIMNDSYIDAGATAIDNVDGNLTVTTTGSVNTSISGEHTITYTATDSAGNTASAVRTVIVLLPISHRGTSYGIVNSPYTGRVWLDKNLGASQVCTSLNDTACYGDYYQWGRNYDGHQVSTSSTTTTQATDVYNVGHGNFITNTSAPYDWTSVDSLGATRAANWSTGSSSVCPAGFRVPTIAELKAELLDIGSAEITNNIAAFNSFLKLPSAGSRYRGSGALNGTGANGNVWALTRDGSSSHYVSFGGASAGAYTGFHAYGLSVRCIRNTLIYADIVPPVITITGGATVSILLNDTYSDAGATAIDNADGNLTVTTTGSVNSSIVGDYTITYTATDSAGNVASAVRTVSVLMTHNGTGYSTVTSPYTGRIWLDRNLGASQVCSSYNDPLCYGDYYQWGRNFDGHQDSTSSTTTTLASNINAAGSNYIFYFNTPNDWASADANGNLRSTNWAKTDGSSVCPAGFRVPTLTELQAETLDNGVIDRTTAFTNFLKLPSAGYRNSGGVNAVGQRGQLWVNSLHINSTATYSRAVYFNSGNAFQQIQSLTDAQSVRCIKN